MGPCCNLMITRCFAVQSPKYSFHRCDIRIYPDVTLKTLRSELGALLGAERSIEKFSFLKCVGRSLALVSAAVVFYGWLSSTRQAVETNNADRLINKFTIQAATLRCVKCGYAWKRVNTQCFYCPASYSSKFPSLTGQEQTGEWSESENIRATICMYNPCSVFDFKRFFSPS